jgi:hypothetical protein
LAVLQGYAHEMTYLMSILNQSTGDSYTHAAILACASAVKRSTAAVISGA